MKIDRFTKTRVSGILVFALALSFGAANAGDSLDREETAVNEVSEVSEAPVLLSEEIASPAVTAGVVNDLMNVSNVAVTRMNLASVGQAAAELPVEDETDRILSEYSNLGIADIKEGNLNVREKATTGSKVVGKMTRHNACEILEEDGEWYKITSGKVDGYVKAEYIITGEEAYAIAKKEVVTVAKVKDTATLRVREDATVESATLALVGEGESLVVSDEKDGWYHVEVDDQMGYVSGDYVELSMKLPTAQTITEIRFGSGVSDVRVDLVAYALQFVGNRYVWGGTSLTNGVDCSGFTMQIYRKYGISLPHHSGSQPAYGTRIKASAARPGDLFFYGNGSRIGHVGIYIGNGQIVHASSARTGIKVSNAYYRTPICVVSYLP